MKKHFFFDMDGTLTDSTQRISDSMKKTLARFLALGADVVVVSGARREKMIEQLDSASEEVALLAQNGNHAETASGQALWKREMNWRQKHYVFDLIYKMYSKQEDDVDDVFDIVQDRGCQVSYSLIGHTAKLDKKIACDPYAKMRLSLMKQYAEDFKRIEDSGVLAAVGGTTCIDFFTHTKGMNVKAFIEDREWNPDECVYIGDALFPGGNDETVKGVIDTFEVSGPVEAEKFIVDASKLMKVEEIEEDLEDDDDDESDEV